MSLSPRLYRRLESNISTSIANARVPDGMTMAALLISHPLELRLNALVLLQSREGTEKDTDGVPPADCVLRP